MIEIFNIINEKWIVPKNQLMLLMYSGIPYINHVFYLSHNSDITICNVRIFYRGYSKFQLCVLNLPSKNIKFQYKDSNGKYYPIQEFSIYGQNIFKTDNEELEIKMTGMYIFETNEYPTILRTGFNADFFGLFENNDKEFEIIVGKNANKKIGALKKMFHVFGNKSSKKRQKLRIHKELLIIQSPVFEAMFRSGMKEAKTNTLKIIDFNFKTVKAAIDFFYGQDIFTDLNLSDIFELFRFADKYDIDELRDCLETFCAYFVTPLNVHQIANYSIQMYLIKLRNYCKDFIKVCNKHFIYIKDSTVLDKEFFAEIWKEDYPHLLKHFF